MGNIGNLYQQIINMLSSPSASLVRALPAPSLCRSLLFYLLSFLPFARFEELTNFLAQAVHLCLQFVGFYLQGSAGIIQFII